jgi:DegV family protein with EDD domain
MKIAVVTDSNSGITQAQAKEMGVAVLPMPFMIDGETYYEDITLTREQFYQRLKDNADIATSQPTPDSILKMWDKLLKEYDQIIHIPMSSGLPGSCSTAMMLAGEDEYEGKVFVVDNRRISVTQYQSVKDAQMLAAMGMDGTQIKKRLEETAADSVIFITVDTLKYLKKGGRITPAAAALGTLLRIKPVLIILGEKLDSFAKARTMKQAKTLMMNAIQKELDERLHDSECKDCHLAIAHSDNEEAALEFKKEVEERFPDADIYLAPLSLSIACHIGPGSLAVTATRKMEEEHEKELERANPTHTQRLV